MRRKIITATFLLVGISLATVGSLRQGAAYRLIGPRYSHSAISHQGDLDNYASAALREWGLYSSVTDGGSGTDITITLSSAYTANQAVTYADGIGTRCQIVVNATNWATRDERLRQLIITHEVGHCLGLGHSQFLGVLMQSNDGTPIPQRTTYPMAGDDIAGIGFLYPKNPTTTPTPAVAQPSPPIGPIHTVPPTTISTVQPEPTPTQKAIYHSFGVGLAADH